MAPTTTYLTALAMAWAVASASPFASSASSPKLTSKIYNATFDNEVNLNPAVPSQPVGLDYNLYWQDFLLNTPGSGVTTAAGLQTIGVAARSAPNVASYAFNSDVEGGDLTVAPFASAVAGVQGSTLKAFDLLDFFFGCAANTAASTVGVSTGCTITVQGHYYSSGAASPVAFFTFLPSTTSVTSPMAHAVLPAGFLALKNVTFTTVVSNTEPALTGTFLDNVHYIGYS